MRTAVPSLSREAAAVALKIKALSYDTLAYPGLVEELAADMADALEMLDPSFDRTGFLLACGLTYVPRTQ